MNKKVKECSIIGGISIVMIISLVLGVDFLNERRNNYNGYIPESVEMRHVAIKEVERQQSFEELQRRIKADIESDAKKGALSTTVYVGEYTPDQVREVSRRLHFQGYKVKEDDHTFGKYLEITW